MKHPYQWVIKAGAKADKHFFFRKADPKGSQHKEDGLDEESQMKEFKHNIRVTLADSEGVRLGYGKEKEPTTPLRWFKGYDGKWSDPRIALGVLNSDGTFGSRAKLGKVEQYCNDIVVWVEYEFDGEEMPTYHPQVLVEELKPGLCINCGREIKSHYVGSPFWCCDCADYAQFVTGRNESTMALVGTDDVIRTPDGLLSIYTYERSQLLIENSPGFETTRHLKNRLDMALFLQSLGMDPSARLKTHSASQEIYGFSDKPLFYQGRPVFGEMHLGFMGKAQLGSGKEFVGQLLDMGVLEKIDTPPEELKEVSAYVVAPEGVDKVILISSMRVVLLRKAKDWTFIEFSLKRHEMRQNEFDHSKLLEQAKGGPTHFELWSHSKGDEYNESWLALEATDDGKYKALRPYNEGTWACLRYDEYQGNVTQEQLLQLRNQWRSYRIHELI